MDAGTRWRLRGRAMFLTSGWFLAAGLAPVAGCSMMTKIPGVSAQAPDDPRPVVRPAGEPTMLASSPILAASVEGATPQIRVVAVIGSDVFITDDEVWQMVRQRIMGGEKEAGAVAEEPKAREKKLFDEELKRLIERELILADFLTKIKKNNPRILDDLKGEATQMAKRNMVQFKQQNNIASEDRLVEALQRQGMSHKLLMRQLERNAMLQIYMGTYLKDKGKTISTGEVQRYYDEHAEEFRTEDKIVWYDLFVSYSKFATPAEARRRADELLKQARAGQDFAALVKQHGHGDSPLRGGVGIGTKPDELKPAEIAPQVVALKAGEVSEVIPTERGLHIVKVTEREVAGVRPLEERVQSFIRSKLTAMIKDGERDKLVAELQRRTTVRIVEENQ